MNKKIRVLIIDDSELIRSVLVELLSTDDSIEVVGTAFDPIDAREKIKSLSPDVLTLDIEMPRMDGLTFLANLMRLRPTPVVMISTLTDKRAEATLKAMELGAVDFVAKPKMAVREKLPELAASIVHKIKVAAEANVIALECSAKSPQSRALANAGSRLMNGKIEAIVIGASTGGTEAIKAVLVTLPKLMPPIVIVQHMPESFTHSFAKRLDDQVELNVVAFNSETCHAGQELLDGHVYIASGQHMCVNQRSGKLCGLFDDGPPVNRHKPSVDVLFESIAMFSSNNVVAVILTGMGADGACGMHKVRSGGAVTIAQSKNSSVVWGMPRAAVEQDAASEVLPLEEIGNRLIGLCYDRS